MKTFIQVALIFILFSSFLSINEASKYKEPDLGQMIDTYRDVSVFYNGDVKNVFGRNLTEDGYNLGLLYQCVEFVKRFYYLVYDHKMPYTYGNAKDLYDPEVPDGKLNTKRDLLQFRNGSIHKPQLGDIIVFNSDENNPFGHAGIVCKIHNDNCEIIQQNVGEHSRARFKIVKYNDLYYLSDRKILAWLRK